MTRDVNRKRPTAVERLMAAMDRCAVARGEAQWTHGYRTAIAKTDGAEEARLYVKEQAQWHAVEKTQRAFRRLAQRVVRSAARPHHSSHTHDGSGR